MIGVSFDPAQDPYQQHGQSGPNASTAPRGIQEAIKILSLRLPKVLGANAVSPRALLTAPGAGGSPVDGVVQRIIQKYFPQASPETLDPMFAPVVGQPGPDRSGTMPVGERVKASPFQPAPPSSSILIPRSPTIKIDQPNLPPQTPQLPGRPGGDNPYEDIVLPPPFWSQPPPPPPAFMPPDDPYPMI